MAQCGRRLPLSAEKVPPGPGVGVQPRQLVRDDHRAEVVQFGHLLHAAVPPGRPLYHAVNLTRTPCTPMGRPHLCLVCSRNFATPAGLKKHLSLSCSCGPSALATQGVEHPGRDVVGEHASGRHVCPHCGKSFGTAAYLAVHSRVHTGERPFACATCGKAFVRRSNLRAHLVTHTRERPHACPRPGCAQRFQFRKQLERHVHAEHAEQAVQAVQPSARYGQGSPVAGRLSGAGPVVGPVRTIIAIRGPGGPLGAPAAASSLLRPNSMFPPGKVITQVFRCPGPALPQQWRANGASTASVCLDCGKDCGTSLGLALHALEESDHGQEERGGRNPMDPEFIDIETFAALHPIDLGSARSDG